MDLLTNYIEKFRPRAFSKNQPRCERDELLYKFLAALNPDQIADGRKPYTHGQLAKKLTGWSNQALYQLYKECSDASVRSFGAMMIYKLKRTN